MKSLGPRAFMALFVLVASISLVPVMADKKANRNEEMLKELGVEIKMKGKKIIGSFTMEMPRQ